MNKTGVSVPSVTPFLFYINLYREPQEITEFLQPRSSPFWVTDLSSPLGECDVPYHKLVPVEEECAPVGPTESVSSTTLTHTVGGKVYNDLI